MQNLTDQYLQVQHRIRQAEIKFKREPDSVRLLAVSKQQTNTAIEHIFSHGQRDFGESYAQEALGKIDALQNLPICWHFIGPIQSNKTRILAEKFDWVHSIDRFKIAKRLNDQRSENFKPLNICLQIKLDSEDSKSGITPKAALELATAISELPKLCLRGIMAIPLKQTSLTDQRKSFARFYEFWLTLKAHMQQQSQIDTLSMGMSNDLEAAIAEGATMIRIGTSLFGQRKAKE